MISKITSSPALVRVVPFAVFLVLTFLQDKYGEAGRYWIYLAKTIAGAAMLAAVWRHIAELEWRFSWEAALAGVAVFALWVGLDGYYPHTESLYAEYLCPLLTKLGLTKSCAPAHPGPDWNPNAAFGPGSALAILFLVARIAGSSLIVPPLEEVFFRSFVYRYLAAKDFLAVPMGKFLPIPFFVTALAFGLEHRQWLAGILCAFIYQGLVIKKGRLGDAVTAHAITNFLLGFWVVGRAAWQFW